MVHGECSVKGSLQIPQVKLGVTKAGEADFDDLTVLPRAHPNLERVTTLKPQNPETHFSVTIYPQVLDPEPDTKLVGAASSFF